MSIRAQLAFVLVAFAAGQLKAFAMADWLVDAWRVEEGLPENTVNAIAQTPDGYLWLATFNGLARFDGIRFVVFDAANTPELKSSRIHQLHLDSRGHLWTISEFGHLARMADDRFTSFGLEEGLPGRVHTLHEDGKGLLWADVGGPAKYLLDGSRFVAARNTNYINIDSWPEERSQAGANLTRTNWNPNGATFRPGDRARLTIGKEQRSTEFRTLVARDGSFWVVNDRAQRFREGRWDLVLNSPTPLKMVSALCEDQQDNLWVGTWEQGLFRFNTNGNVRQLRLTDSAVHWPIRALFEDREGNVWIGTGGDGLRRLRLRTVTVYDHGSGLRADVVRSLAEDNSGKVWVCGLGGIDWIAPGAPAAATASPFSMAIPWAMLADRRGAMWIGTYNEGLFRHQNGELTHFVGIRATNQIPSAVNVIHEDRAGEIHVGTPQGLFRVHGDCLKPADCGQGLPSMDVRAIAEDKSGHFYVGLNGGGLLRRKEGRWTRLSSGQGSSENHVWSIYVDDEDTVWVGTVGKGLSRFRNGQFFSFSAAQLPLPRLITSILEDGDGRLWLGSHQGIFRVGRAELNAFADGRNASITTVRYGKGDGMGSSECVGGLQPSACKTRDGRLWFPTVKGVCVVDPKNTPFNPLPPPVVIADVVADGRSINTGASKGSPKAAVIPPGTGRLEINYAGLSFIAPEKVRFKYKLEGLDGDWLDGGVSRVAHYMRVPPGEYTFRVKAANNDGVWNETGAALTLAVLPSWWQTSWFRSGAFLAVGLTVAGAYRWRVRGLKRDRAAQEEFSRKLIASQEQERQRIAAELHDSLGQSLLVIKSHAILASRESNLPAGVVSHLQELNEVTGHAIGEVRSIAQHLRPFHLDQLGLTRAVRGMITQVAGTGNLKLRHQLAGVDRLFSAEGEINFFRMVQELSTNVVRHANATELRVTIARDSREVVLRVEDNGQGFRDTQRQGSGIGLRSVAERVRIMRGKWSVHSTANSGTIMEIRLPLESSVRPGATDAPANKAENGIAEETNEKVEQC